MPHSSCDRSPVRQLRSLFRHSRHCSDPVGTCDTMCGRAWHCSCRWAAYSFVLLLLQNPRQVWVQPSNEVRTLTRARPPPAEPSAHRQVKHRGRYLPQQPPQRPQESPGLRRDLRETKELPKTTATPGATLFSTPQCTSNSNRSLHTPDSGRRR